ncbi:MAG: M16 family metallopeptidase [Bacillota bacterium]|uniref:Insulinase family protein n=1 Tax=Virgibacillus salarius TaxID=447199 RepID=A0A941IB10_9BACI|nr:MULTISPECIES: pitrilysin family protein [Bacillaceae]NAZ07540.1 insulinase family protein [Agaribacter marinus]MBR7794820.1 insulinase family protein [Virgibacillus salarius]MCC2249233.1 insulinase family protein [Virgibacillus sp. AGTR]QRZ17271.1 insulinase family protein [Virgibacillus sp. AGTR]WBX79529.1 pitrilysin family protein [Virgibacillus salarius]
MIEKHTCKNGLRVVLEPIPAVRSVTVGIWVLTGSRNESIANNGISHFLEHMFFKGTINRSPQDIAEEFDAIGGQVNAFTSKEYTCFYAKVLDTHKDKALEILADMFFNSTFDEEEMEKEKKVVYEEIKMYEDTPDDIVHDYLARASYGNHPLGFPILGSMDHVKSFTPDELRNYMKERYTPQNVVISIAGNVDSSYLEAVEGYFGNYQTDHSPSLLTKPAFVSEKLIRQKDTEQAHLCMGYNGLAVDDENIYSLIIMNNVLGGSMSSRLFQDVREKQGLAYSVFSYHSSFIDNGLLTIYAGTGKDQLDKLTEVIEGTIATFSKNGLTDKELQNSKEQLKGSLLLSLESTNSRMSRNGKNELILQQHRSLDEMVQVIDEVSHASIHQVMDSIFQQSPSIALIAPDTEN